MCACSSESINSAASSDPLHTRLASVMASAALVASSSMEAFEIGSPVKSQTTV